MSLLQHGDWRPARHRDTFRYPPARAGGVATSNPPANPSAWLSDKLWRELWRLGAAGPAFEGLAEDFAEQQDAFKVCAGEGQGGKGGPPWCCGVVVLAAVPFRNLPISVPCLAPRLAWHPACHAPAAPNPRLACPPTQSPPARNTLRAACPQVVFDAPDPTTSMLPARWTARLDSFQRLALLRCLRPDRCAGGPAGVAHRGRRGA